MEMIMEIITEQEIEMILDPANYRLVLYPIIHSDIWNMYKQAQASYWVAEELDLSDDRRHWNLLTNDEREFITMVLAFFASADTIVNENIGANFGEEVMIAEAKMFYDFQKLACI